MKTEKNDKDFNPCKTLEIKSNLHPLIWYHNSIENGIDKLTKTKNLGSYVPVFEVMQTGQILHIEACTENQKAIGFCSYNIPDKNSNICKDPYILGFWVDENFRNIGIEENFMKVFNSWAYLECINNQIEECFQYVHCFADRIDFWKNQSFEFYENKLSKTYNDLYFLKRLFRLSEIKDDSEIEFLL